MWQMVLPLAMTGSCASELLFTVSTGFRDSSLPALPTVSLLKILRPSDWRPAEIEKITVGNNPGIKFYDSPYGNISFNTWDHYGIMLDTGEIFADLGKNGVNAEEERQRLKDYFESGGADTDYIELDDIVL